MLLQWTHGDIWAGIYPTSDVPPGIIVTPSHFWVFRGKESCQGRKVWVPPLGWEDPLEKEMAIHSRILAWEILWTEEPCGLSSMGHKELDMSMY